MKDFKEKRKNVRFETPFCVECRHPSGEKQLPGAMKDISMSGACVLVDSQESLPQTEPISLSLLFPKVALNVKAQIMWQEKTADKNRIGVSFVSLPDRFKEDIYEQIFQYHRQAITSKWWES